MRKHLLTFLGLLGIWTGTAQPTNDNLSNAIIINSLPFSDTVSRSDTDASTLESNELICGNNETWWYVFTPTQDMTVTITSEMQGVSFGQLSNDIRVGLFNDNQLSHPLNLLLNCINNDAGDGHGEKEDIFLNLGTTYYIQVATSNLVVSDRDVITEIEEVTYLPVEILSFEAKVQKNQTRISWKTASEHNNKGFELQRSQNAKSWKPLSFIKGENNSLTPKLYEWMDTIPFSGINYYRLKQIDYDGDYEFSQVISVTLDVSSSNWMVYPNPTDGLLYY
ncbi:MAG: hypothetical protein AAF599_09365, partial [Bacteroidota bacterium]